MRAAFTLVEMVTSLALVCIVAATAVPRFAHLRDRLAVHGATSALTTALADARHSAARWNRRTAVTVDTSQALVVVRAGTDTLSRASLLQLFGVTLSASRDSVAYSPSTIGYGAANATLIVRRGAAAETVTVSRLGRVRR